MSETQTIKVATLQGQWSNHPVGTILEVPNGCLWRVVMDRKGRCGARRITKRTANGWELMKGESL